MAYLQQIKRQFDFGDFPREVWIVAAIQCVGGTGFAIAFIYLALYYYQERGLPMTLVGMIQLVSGLLSGVFQIVGGILGDRFGYRRTALAFSVASVIAAGILAVLIAVNAPTWSIVVTAILRQNLGSGGGASMNAIIANASSRGRMTESYSLLAMISNVSWAVGPVIGGFLLGFASFAWLFAIGFALLALGLIGFLYLPRDSGTQIAAQPRSIGLKFPMPDRKLFGFSLLVLLFFLTLAQWGATLSVFTIDRLGFTTGQYGLLMSIGSIIIILLQYPASHMCSEHPRRALVLGCLGYAFGFLSFSWVTTFLQAVGSITIAVIGEVFFIPTALSVVGSLSTHENRGRSMGFYGLCTTLGVSLGPLLGGLLLDMRSSPFYLWGPISLFSFAGALGFWLWKGYTRNATDSGAGLRNSKLEQE